MTLRSHFGHNQSINGNIHRALYVLFSHYWVGDSTTKAVCNNRSSTVNFGGFGLFPSGQPSKYIGVNELPYSDNYLLGFLLKCSCTHSGWQSILVFHVDNECLPSPR